MHSSLGEFVWVYGGYDQLVLGGGFHMTHFATDNGDAKEISGVFGYFLLVFLLFIFVFKWFQPYGMRLSSFSKQSSTRFGKMQHLIIFKQQMGKMSHVVVVVVVVAAMI